MHVVGLHLFSLLSSPSLVAAKQSTAELFLTPRCWGNSVGQVRTAPLHSALKSTLQTLHEVKALHKVVLLFLKKLSGTVKAPVQSQTVQSDVRSQSHLPAFLASHIVDGVQNCYLQ